MLGGWDGGGRDAVRETAIASMHVADFSHSVVDRALNQE